LSASLSGVPAIVEASPGNVVTLPGSGLTAGPNASVVLKQQGSVRAEWSQVPDPFWVDTVLASTFTGTAVSFTVPDGAVSGPLVITADDLSTVTLSLRVASQYILAADYLGEGTDTSDLAPAGQPLYTDGGELDVVLRRASAYIDTWLGYAVRMQPRFETHAWRKSRRTYPFCFPVRSVDNFLVRISNFQQATISPNDIVINQDQRYIEILSYAVASYALLGAIQNLGLIANFVELNYTAGFSMLEMPPEIRQACAMIATELLIYRRLNRLGLAGLGSAKQGQQAFDRRSEPFQVPQPALELLRPFTQWRAG